MVFQAGLSAGGGPGAAGLHRALNFLSTEEPGFFPGTGTVLSGRRSPTQKQDRLLQAGTCHRRF